jgi:hypothetical protein
MGATTHDAKGHRRTQMKMRDALRASKEQEN